MNINDSDHTVRPGVGCGFFKNGSVVHPLYPDGRIPCNSVPTHGNLAKYLSVAIKNCTIAFRRLIKSAWARIARYFTFSKISSDTFSELRIVLPHRILRWVCGSYYAVKTDYWRSDNKV